MPDSDPVKVLRAMSLVQQVEWPQSTSADKAYCKYEASEPVLCPRLLLLLQQHELPISCVSTKLSVSVSGIPPRRLHSAASSISARSKGSRTHTCVGVQVAPQRPVPCLKIMACFRPTGCRFLSSTSVMGPGELLRSLARLSERLSMQVEDMRSPSPKDSFFKVWSVIFSHPDKSRCSREWQAPRDDQLKGKGQTQHKFSEFYVHPLCHRQLAFQYSFLILTCQMQSL